jgi:hypothetical protein
MERGRRRGTLTKRRMTLAETLAFAPSLIKFFLVLPTVSRIEKKKPSLSLCLLSWVILLLFPSK